MTARTLLRIASVSLGLMFLGHTVGAMLMPTSQGEQEDRLLAALSAYRFDVMGFTRSHADFYRGEGFYLSLAIFMVAALCWQLSTISSSEPQTARRFMWLPLLFALGSTVLCLVYFFTAPLVTSVLALGALLLAWPKLSASR